MRGVPSQKNTMLRSAVANYLRSGSRERNAGLVSDDASNPGLTAIRVCNEA